MHLTQVDFITPPSTIFTDFNLFPTQLVGRFLLFAIAMAGLYFFYRLVSTGFSYMSSLGDEARLTGLQRQITYSLYGLLIVISAFFIMQLIQTATGTNLI